MYAFVKLNKKIASAPLVFILLASTSLADEDFTKNHITQNHIEEITVTANRIQGTLDEIGSTIEVITADDIAKIQESSIADILRQVAGLSMSRTGGLGAVTNVRVRGAEAGQAVVILNGVKLNDLASPSGGYNFANMFTGHISQIEVLKGPQSTLYGSDAMGGVISITTKPKLDNDGVAYSGYSEFGSYATLRTGAAATFSNNQLSGYFNVAYVQSDGISAADENAGNTEADPYENLSLSGAMDFSLVENENTKASVGVFTRLSNADISFDSYDWLEGYVDGDETGTVDDSQLGFNGTLNILAGKFKNTFTANWSDIERHDFLNGDRSFDALSKRENFEYIATISPHQYLDILLGGEVENNSIITESFGPWGSRLEGETGTNSMFSEVKLKPNTGLTMTIGARYDDNDDFGDHTSFRTTIAYNHQPTGTILRANFGEGFRAPSLFQLYSSFGNESLKPEVSSGWEFGFEQNIGKENKLSFAATYFENKTQNQINFDMASFKYANLDKTKINGVEVKASFEASEKLSLIANYTYLNAKDVTTDTALLRRPKNSFNLLAHYAWSDKLSNTVTLTHVGEQPDVDATLPNYTVVDLTGAWQFTDSAEIYARVENLFDKEYQEVTAFGTPDRSVYFGIRMKI
jgi:vitamin B12 transporter